MSNNITLNIVEPGSPTPDPVVPNTGLFTSGIGGPEATAIGAVLILTIAAIVVAVCYRKQKKSGKVTKLVHIIDSTKTVLKSKKRITAGLSAIALLASAGTLAVLLVNSGKSNTSAIDGEATAGAETIALVVSGNELTVELGDEPVFAVLPVDITVEEATEAGYTLTAYTDNTDLVSTTDESKVIPMVAVDEGELAALADNTYGLALAKPETKDEEVYTTLSTDADNPTFITDKDYEHTEANDTTTIYYGFYITPDTPYGTYTSSEISYEAKENEVATVVYDGNGLYFSGDRERATNMVRYDTDAITPYTDMYSHTSNLNNDGKVMDDTWPNKMYPVDSSETFVYEFAEADKVRVNVVKSGNDGCSKDQNDYFSFWSGNHPEYTALADYGAGIRAFGNTTGKYVFGDYNDVQTDIEGNTVTFAYTTGPQDGQRGCSSGYGYYAVLTGYDAEGNPVHLKGNGIVSGDYLVPASDSSTYFRFLGWDADSEATEPTYKTEKDIAQNLPLIPGETTTLYAVWQPAFTISYNGNGADSTSNMDNVEQYTTDLTSTEKQVDLLASNFKKEGYGFAGWSTDQDAASKINNTGDDKPTIYGPNQMITVDPSASTKLNLYAVWVPAETNVTMQTFSPNSEPYASKPNGTVIALEDERDNQVYAVAKLADGNYWMIENLRLDNEPELSTTNTHNPDLPLTNNYEEQTTSNKLSETSNNWCNSWSTTEEQIACYDHSNLNTNNTASTATSPTFSQDFTSSSHNNNFEDNIASYGNYYNWYSATAGNGKQETGSGVTVAGDICPAGWILPIGNQTDANGSFSHLDTSMGGTGGWQGSTEASNRWRSFPNNFVYSGYWYGSSAYSRGNLGYYWSSTALNTDYAYYLYFGSGSVDPGTNGSGKDGGNSVRCVAPVQ